MVAEKKARRVRQLGARRVADGAAVHRVPDARAAARSGPRTSTGGGTGCATRSATSCARCVAALARQTAAVALRPVDREAAMILLINPRATRPDNRRFPLSLMAIGAALPPEMSWEIVDGNLPDMDVVATVSGMDRAAAR